MNLSFQPLLLWSDALIWGLVLALVILLRWSWRNPLQRDALRRLGQSRAGMAAGLVLAVFVLIGLLDSLHYRPPLPAETGKPQAYAVEVRSLLDAMLTPLRERSEKTYSAPLATRLFAMETVEQADGSKQRLYPRLRYGGKHLGQTGLGEEEENAARNADIRQRLLTGIALALLLWGTLLALVRWRRRTDWRGTFAPAEGGLAWDAVLLTAGVVLLLIVPTLLIAPHYHLLGTDKVGQDVLYQMLKSVRTALVIGLVTTLVTLPIGIGLGILAGYCGGWIDDLIQYLYTVLNSIPGVLLIAAAVLMMQVVLDTHPQWFSTAAERADMRLLALCFILGLTSWTGLARLLRGETLKLKALEYIQAAQAFGVSSARILARHLLPNLMHLVIIALVMDFSGLVLAEAVLSYVGIGVDPNMISFGTMINSARLELAREPAVWWTLFAAFFAMFTLVLAANLFADAVRDAFDPRLKGAGV